MNLLRIAFFIQDSVVRLAILWNRCVFTAVPKMWVITRLNYNVMVYYRARWFGWSPAFWLFALYKLLQGMQHDNYSGMDWWRDVKETIHGDATKYKAFKGGFKNLELTDKQKEDILLSMIYMPK